VCAQIDGLSSQVPNTKLNIIGDIIYLTHNQDVVAVLGLGKKHDIYDPFQGGHISIYQIRELLLKVEFYINAMLYEDKKKRTWVFTFCKS
jgi:hypothetical protein